jgi:hypothetical protein
MINRLVSGEKITEKNYANLAYVLQSMEFEFLRHFMQPVLQYIRQSNYVREVPLANPPTILRLLFWNGWLYVL